MINDIQSNNTSTAMDDLDLDAGDLSEWLDPKYDPSTIVNELPLTDVELGDCSFDEDVFRDCKEMEDEPEQVFSRHYSSRRSSRSPPRRRARKLSPERVNRPSFETPPASSRTHLDSSPVISSSTGDDLYNAALENLASSMRRSEMSRVQVLRHRDSRISLAPRRNSLSCAPRKPAPSTMNGLADLLSGKRSALTAGLEQSRNQLRMYMSLLNKNQPF